MGQGPTPLHPLRMRVLEVNFLLTLNNVALNNVFSDNKEILLDLNTDNAIALTLTLILFLCGSTHGTPRECRGDGIVLVHLFLPDILLGFVQGSVTDKCFIWFYDLWKMSKKHAKKLDTSVCYYCKWKENLILWNENLVLAPAFVRVKDVLLWLRANARKTSAF